MLQEFTSMRKVKLHEGESSIWRPRVETLLQLQGRLLVVQNYIADLAEWIYRYYDSCLLFNLALCFLFMQVSILIPECAFLPASIYGIINTFNSYYRVRDLPLYKLLEEDFLEKVVKKGKLC